MEIPWGRALISSFSLRLFFLLRLSASMKSPHPANPIIDPHRTPSFCISIERFRVHSFIGSVHVYRQ